MRGMMRLAIMGVPGAQGGGATPIVYLLRDEFTTDEAAPLTSPRAAEPGPGTLTLVQTDGQFSIGGDQLSFPAQTAPIWGDQGFHATDAQAQEVGLFLISSINLTIKSFCVLGLHSEAELCNPNLVSAGGGFYFPTGALRIFGAGENYFDIGTNLSESTDYKFACGFIAADTLALMAKGGAFIDWTLLWIAPGVSAANLYPMFSNFSSSGTIDTLAMRIAGGLLSQTYGIASVNQATPASGTSYAATADAIHDLEVTAPNPLSGSAALKYRVTDADNYWTAYLNDAGAFRADSVAAGTPTNRVNVAGVAVAAEACLIRVICNGTKHNYYTLAGTTWTKRGGEITLSHQDTATAIVPEATDYTLGALRSYPTTSPAYAELDRT